MGCDLHNMNTFIRTYMNEYTYMSDTFEIKLN